MTTSTFIKTVLLGSALMAVGHAQAAYDYELEATVNADARWYGTRGTDDEHGDINRYYLVLGNKTLGDDGKTFQPEGKYYAFEFFGPAPKVTTTPEGISTFRPVDGTYETHTVQQGSTTAWLKDNFSLWGAAYYSFDGQGRLDKDLSLPEGKLTITTVDEFGTEYMCYDAIFTDQNGQTHHLTYKTRYVGYRDCSQSSGYLNKDLDMEGSMASANYESRQGDTMKVNFFFQWDGTWSDDESEPYKDMAMLYVNAFMPCSEDGSVQNGTYTIKEPSGDDFSLELGQMVVMAGGVEYPLGSYAMYVDRRHGVHWGTFKEGTMAISGEGKTRKIVCDFTTALGHTVKLTWEGEISIESIPYSTLTADRKLDLEGATAVASYLGDPYRTDGSTWHIRLNPAPGKKDGFQTVITSDSPTFEDGIAEGDYLLSVDTDNLWPYQYQMGIMTDVLSGTWYLSDFDENNVPHTFAPATGGENEYFKIARNADDTYTFDFLFNDGINHIWYGKWTGPLQKVDFVGIDSAVSDTIRVEAEAGAITITGLTGQNYEIYNMAGAKIAAGVTSDSTTVPVARGLYLVRMGSKTHKICVR